MPFFVLVLFIALFSLADAKTVQDKTVDSLFAKWDKGDVPGASLGVFRDGKILYTHGYGLANMEYGIENDSDTVFRIGSTSKQFTAASIMLLVQQGKLSLDDTLSSFFPDFPQGKQIKVKHLIHHTSGIRDYLMLAYLKGLTDEDYYEDKDVMKWLMKQQELNFEPGSNYQYSNSGYWLLGQIVKQVAGVDMAAFARKNLFEPLGMHHTHFHNNHKEIVKKRASGYAPTQDNGYQISMTTLNMIGDGGVFTTVNDLKKWDDAFYQSDVLRPAFWEAMTQQGILNDGTAFEYASGLIIGEYKGLKTISHGGAFVGFRAEMVRFPEQHTTVVILANRGDAKPTGLAYKVADVYLQDQFKATLPEKKPSEVSAASPEKSTLIKQLVGQYELKPGMQIKLSAVGNRLHAKQLWNDIEYDLQAVTGQANTYALTEDPSTTFTFQKFMKQKSTEINLIKSGQPSIWKRIKANSNTLDLEKFVGDYHSAELDVVYNLALHDGGIVLRMGDNEPLVLAVSDPDTLSYRGIISQFEYKDGQVSGFNLRAGRVKNLWFNKQ